MQESSKKLYVDAQTLLVDSIKLARMVWNDKFCPTVLVSVWRGGTLPGIATDEFFRCRGQRLHHAVIKAQSYDGMEQGESGVQVEGIEDIAAIVKNDDRLLIIDDVFDTGHTMVAIMNEISEITGIGDAECRSATVYYKPANNKTAIEPSYYVLAEDRWIVFPHEIIGLTDEELQSHRPELYAAGLSD